MNQNINLFINQFIRIIICINFISIKDIMSNITETIQELNKCEDCKFFTFDGEIHLAKITKCYDGDTFHCIFKHNGIYQKFHIRMEGYDSWEIKPNKTLPENKRNALVAKAHLAKERLEGLILNKNVYVYCKKFDKYGRILASVKLNLNDTKTINDIMIEEKYGYEYYGGTKKQDEDN